MLDLKNPFKPSDSKLPTRSWRRSLLVRIPGILIILFLGITVLFFAVMEFRVKSELERHTRYLIEQSGQTMVSELGKRIQMTESVATSLAILGETFHNDTPYARSQMVNIINHKDAKELIAGGGIWPEPYALDKKRKRYSLFWGRNQKGNLQFFDDYNDPEGPGYHNEEWYVPARFIDRNSVYWSKSYMDPYSLEPMVTCTAPMYRDDQFIGVATIDLKLSGLTELLSEIIKNVDGYAYVVDRNGRLLSSLEKDNHNKYRTEDGYLHIDALAREHPALAIIDESLRKIRENFVSQSLSHDPSLYEAAQKIEQLSYQIDDRESQLISSIISNSKLDHEGNLLQFFNTENDYLLNEPAIVSIYQVPETFWKIIFAAKESSFIDPVSDFHSSLIWSFIGLFLVAIAVTLIVIVNNFILPLSKIQSELRHSIEHGGEKHQDLSYKNEDEIGMLVHWFNRRSRQLDRALNELRDAKEHAQNADNAKSEFLATMTHEIRTPLNGVTGFANLLLETEMNDEQKEYVKAINANGNTLLCVIEDILDFSKIEANKIELEKHPFVLGDCLSEVRELMEPQTKAKGLSFSMKSGSGIPDVVIGDLTRLRQILINLCTNACKFTNEGGIEVQAHAGKKLSNKELVNLEFEVKDTGIGISPESMENLFEPFKQAASSIKRQYGGSGLGLAICKRLIESMGGKIRVNSELEAGSSFKFDVFLGRGNPKNLEEVKGTSNRISSHAKLSKKCPMDILVAEDNIINQKLLGQLLGKMGYHPDFAVNGIEVLNCLQRKSYDLILMDNLMPDMNGVEAAELIRQGEVGEENSTIHIIAVTANAFKKNQENCLEAGMDDFLSKPIRIGSLVDALKRAHNSTTKKTTPKEKTAANT